MSVGPLGGLGSAAGSPLAQNKGTDVDRAQHEVSNQSRHDTNAAKAEAADGIAATDAEDQRPSERDADGRRLWEVSQQKKKADDLDEQLQPQEDRKSKDPSGQSGNQLDLTG